MPHIPDQRKQRTSCRQHVEAALAHAQARIGDLEKAIREIADAAEEFRVEWDVSAGGYELTGAIDNVRKLIGGMT